ncbi:MAG: CHASE4 domain-containing protein [bacterium]|nr:CHASE4 domain-containing protein [bacterium]
MTLRQKTLAAVGITIVALVAALYGISRNLMLNRFLELEQRDVQTNVHRALEAVTADLNNLESDVGDWAPWDDVYQFIEDGNEEFLIGNCLPVTFENLDISLMLFVHSTGRIVYGEIYDSQTKELSPVPPELIGHILAYDTLLKHDTTNSSIRGLLDLPEGPMLIASQPIVTSDYQGPIRGTLIMGRFLDAGMIKMIAKRTRLRLEILPFDHPRCSLNCQEHRDLLALGRGPLVEAENERTVAGYGMIRGLYGEPAFVMRTHQPRIVYGQGRASLTYFFALLIIMGVTCWAAISVLLDKQVVRRVEALARRVQEIGRNKDLSARVAATGSDEIARLAGDVNATLEALEKNAAALKASHAALKEEMLAHQQADEERIRLQKAVESSGAVVFMTDSKGVFTYINSEFTRLYGYSSEEVVGKYTPRILISETHDEELYRDFWNSLHDKEVVRQELKNLTKNGEIIDVSVSVNAVIGADGNIEGYLAIQRDITELRHSEQLREAMAAQLRQSQKMETIGTLAGGIAHDFNNILVPILIYTELAMKNTPEGCPSREELDHVIRAANRAKDLVKQILAFSRQSEEERIAVRFQFVVKETLKLLRASVPTTIDIVDLVDTNCPEVLADPSQLHQVLMNLCTNAAHAIGENDGVIEVGMDTVEADDDLRAKLPQIKPGTYVCLTVRDSGSGMDSKTLSRIFEPFFTTKPPGSGTGLGLSVVHGIITAHGGTVSVESTPGEGSTFRVYLPAAPAVKPTQREKTDPVDVRGTERILFVDDEPEITDVAARVMKRYGYDMVVYTDSAEALNAFRAAPDSFDVVMTDQTMPHLTGDRLTKELHAIRPDLPVILITGFSETVTLDNFRQLGIRDLVMKPLVGREMAAAIRRAMNGKDAPVS